MSHEKLINKLSLSWQRFFATVPGTQQTLNTSLGWRHFDGFTSATPPPSRSRSKARNSNTSLGEPLPHAPAISTAPKTTGTKIRKVQQHVEFLEA